MSASKQPSFVGIDEKADTFTFTVGYLTSWYDSIRCDGCPRFHRLALPQSEIVKIIGADPIRIRTDTKAGFCDLIEAEEPCEITGVGPEGEK